MNNKLQSALIGGAVFGILNQSLRSWHTHAAFNFCSADNAATAASTSGV